MERNQKPTHYAGSVLRLTWNSDPAQWVGFTGGISTVRENHRMTHRRERPHHSHQFHHGGSQECLVGVQPEHPPRIVQIVPANGSPPGSRVSVRERRPRRTDKRLYIATSVLPFPGEDSDLSVETRITRRSTPAVGPPMAESQFWGLPVLRIPTPESRGSRRP